MFTRIFSTFVPIYIGEQEVYGHKYYRNESCCSGSITQTEDKYIKSRSEIIDGIVYNINSVFDMTSKSTAEDKLKYLLRSAAEKLS